MEWYDPSVFYLHALSKDGEALKILTRQDFVIRLLSEIISQNRDYLVKDDLHVFLDYKKRKLYYVVIYQCRQEKLDSKIEQLGV